MYVLSVSVVLQLVLYLVSCFVRGSLRSFGSLVRYVVLYVCSSFVRNFFRSAVRVLVVSLVMYIVRHLLCFCV